MRLKGDVSVIPKYIWEGTGILNDYLFLHIIFHLFILGIIYVRIMNGSFNYALK